MEKVIKMVDGMVVLLGEEQEADDVNPENATEESKESITTPGDEIDRWVRHQVTTVGTGAGTVRSPTLCAASCMLPVRRPSGLSLAALCAFDFAAERLRRDPGKKPRDSG